MANVELLFGFPPKIGSPVDLVFGETLEPPVIDEIHASGHIQLSVGVSLAGLVLPTVHVTGSFSLSVTLTVGGVAKYDSNTERPVVSLTRSSFQTAGQLTAGSISDFQTAEQMVSGSVGRYQDATNCPSSVRTRYQDANRRHIRSSHRYQDAKKVIKGLFNRYQDTIKTQVQWGGRYQEAKGLSSGVRESYQDTQRVTARITSDYQNAGQLNRRFVSGMQDAIMLYALAQPTRYQDAMWPPAGVRNPPIPPQPEPCYTPSPHLLFQHLLVAGDTNLLFVCDAKTPPELPEPPSQVVVPVKEVYFVINNIALIRVSDGKPIPTNTMSLSLDVDSWTWGFSASIPGYAFQDLVWQSGEPTEVQATVNGTPFRFIIESIGRERTFARDDLRVSGRGRAAFLDSPYAPVLKLFADIPLTARQLVDWSLTENGVSLGWTVDWQLQDWPVPASVFSHTGSYMGAVTRIAEAAGGYVQPHNTAETLHIMHRYPVAPWDWGSVTPNFELPSAVVTTEGTEWELKPYYNRVFVRGEAQGVNGRITRAGTAGDMGADSVVDNLITHHDAALQRGRTILSDVGRVSSISLRLPVLAETGIIKPGNFVRYTDGGQSKIGLTRSVSVEVASIDSVWQTIGIEHHDELV